jgi:hypothetical protein
MNNTAMMDAPHIVGALGIGFLICHLLLTKSMKSAQTNKEGYSLPQFMLPSSVINSVYDNVGAVRSRVNREIMDAFRNSSVFNGWNQSDKERARQAAQAAISARAKNFSTNVTSEQMYELFNEAHNAFQASLVDAAARRGDPILQEEPLRLTRPIDHVALRGAPQLDQLPQPATI